MKVLHVNSYYSNRMFYKNLYDIQINNGLDIDVYVPVPFSYKKTDKNMGSYTMLSHNHGKYDRLIFHLKHHRIYKDIIKKYEIGNFSLVHAHSLFSNGYIALRLKQDYGIPYIVAVRSTDLYTFFGRMIHLRKLGVKILREADRVIFLSETFRDKVLKEYITPNLRNEIYDKTAIIPNGIDAFWINNKGNIKETSCKNNLKLLYVGIINKNKNISATVKAIEILQRQGYNVEYTVVGKIEDQAIYKQIENKPHIKYVQPMPKEDLIEVYRRNDIFVMPSIHETFGLVYAEAISQGLPVIYTKDQGFDGQFENGVVGYSVDCFSPEDIANKILDVIKNYKSLTSNCIELCSKFDWNLLEKEYKRIYEECLANL